MITEKYERSDRAPYLVEFDMLPTKRDKYIIEKIHPGWYQPIFKKKRGKDQYSVEFRLIDIGKPSDSQVLGQKRDFESVNKLMLRLEKQEYPFTDYNISDWWK